MKNVINNSIKILKFSFRKLPTYENYLKIKQSLINLNNIVNSLNYLNFNFYTNKYKLIYCNFIPLQINFTLNGLY